MITANVFCVAVLDIPTSLYWNAFSLFPYQYFCVLPCFFSGAKVSSHGSFLHSSNKIAVQEINKTVLM